MKTTRKTTKKATKTTKVTPKTRKSVTKTTKKPVKTAVKHTKTISKSKNTKKSVKKPAKSAPKTKKSTRYPMKTFDGEILDKKKDFVIHKSLDGVYTVNYIPPYGSGKLGACFGVFDTKAGAERVFKKLCKDGV